MTVMTKNYRDDIDKYELFERVGYKPHGVEQKKIHDSKARFIIPTCGRRFGKSQAAGHEMTSAMMLPDKYYWIIGPTYKTGEKEFRVVYDDLVRKLKLGGKIRKSYNVKQGDMRIEMPWNTVLEVVSADKQDSLVGEGLDGAILSEAALHSMSTWSMYIEPALSDKLGWCIFPSTPRGNNWYKGLWKLGQQADQNDYESWRFPSWMNAAMYPGGFDPHCRNIVEEGHHYDIFKCNCNREMVRLFNNVSIHYWLQEYAAEFTTFEGQIYDKWDETIHVKRISYNPLWRNYIALDFGFSDPTVVLDIMVDSEDNVYVWREYQVRYKTSYEHAHVIKNRENPEGYHVDRWFADPRGADPIATMQMVLGVWIEANPQPWDVGVEAVRRWLKPQPNGQPKLFIDPSCTELIRQMGELKTPEVKKQGEKNIERRPGTRVQHDNDDHGPDALRYFFNEWEVLRTEGNLTDVYDRAERGSEAESFFKLNSSSGLTTLNSRIGYR